MAPNAPELVRSSILASLAVRRRGGGYPRVSQFAEETPLLAQRQHACSDRTHDPADRHRRSGSVRIVGRVAQEARRDGVGFIETSPPLTDRWLALRCAADLRERTVPPARDQGTPSRRVRSAQGIVRGVDRDRAEGSSAKSCPHHRALCLESSDLRSPALSRHYFGVPSGPRLRARNPVALCPDGSAHP